MSPFRPRLNAHTRTWNRTTAGNKSNELIVCGTINGKSSHANLQGATMNPDAFGTGSLGLDMNREDRPVLVVLHDHKAGIHNRRGSKNGFDKFENAALHVGIVGDRMGDGYITGSLRRHTLLDQCPGID